MGIRKGYVMGVLLVIFGLYCLSLNLIFTFSFAYIYVQLAFTLLFIIGGLAILIRLSAKVHQHTYTPVHDKGQSLAMEIRSEFQILSADTHFFIIEFAKVAAVILLAMAYPLEGFIVFVVLDILDGWMLPHRKRSLILRHRIDKFTDFLCQIPFYIVAITLFSFWIVAITIFFIITTVKTFIFVKTGNPRWLIYLPGFLLVFHMFALVISRFLSQWNWIFADLQASIYFCIAVVIISVLYEAVYNGVLYKIRYKKEGYG